MDNFVFYDENGLLLDHYRSERTEQLQAYEYVPADSCGVLELGSRYGTVTCAISAKLNRRPVLITVDPDFTIWTSLIKNVNNNNCVAFFIKGTISNKPQAVSLYGYSTHSVPVDHSEIPNFTLKQALEMAQVPKIDTLVADCEGFFETFLIENQDILKDLRVVMFECDGNPSFQTNYENVKQMLRDAGLVEKVNGFHCVWLRPNA
jgi:hypothetical protein